MTLAYHCQDIRNVALTGNGSSGKTSLADALLFTTGATSRPASVDEETSFCDADGEERRRHFSIDSHLLHVAWSGKHLHLIDTPGYPDFIGNTLCALAAVENVIIAVSAATGIEANACRLFQEAGHRGLARFVVVTKLDTPQADFDAVVNQIRATFGPQCVPFYLPDQTGPNLAGEINILTPAATVEPLSARTVLIERIVESDVALLERYLNGDEIAPEELKRAAHQAVRAGSLVPIIGLSTRKNVGLSELLALLSDCGLNPSEMGDPEDAPLVAQVFKTSVDPYMGKLSYLRLHAGHITANTLLVNPRTGKSQRPGHLYRQQGKALEEIEEALAGDIIAVPKCEDLKIADLVTATDQPGENLRQLLKPLRLPKPMVPRAVVAKQRQDEPKIAAALAKIAEEDPTFTFRRDRQTHELVIEGMSELHLDVIQQRLRQRFKIDFATHTPHVPYLETIQTEAEAEYRHKKQTGGRGQFADVSLRIRPLGRGAGFRFVNALKGGVIPAQFVPAVEKGIREQMERGVISGNSAVDIEAEVFFGSYHSVDSSEQAFKIAAAAAFRKAFESASPVLLEPIVKLVITTPTPAFGDISANLAGRRGHVTGSEPLSDGKLAIQALAPLSEVLSLASDLKSMTAGQGAFTMELASYEQLLPQRQQQLVEEWRKARGQIDES